MHYLEINRYLFLSMIVLGIFTILSIGIYYGKEQRIKSTIGISSNILINVDRSVLQFSHYLHVSVLNQFMKFLTEYSREYFWIFVLAIMFFFGGHDGKMATIIMKISFLIVIPTNIIIKDIINIYRPVSSYDSFYTELQSDKSYPSGHTTIVSAGAVAAALFFRNTYKQKLISICLIIEAGLVCFSRLYLGVHYPFDIIEGVLLGSGISLFVASNTLIYERFLQINVSFGGKNKSA